MSNENNRIILEKKEFEERDVKDYYLSQKNLDFIKNSFKEKIKIQSLDLNDLKKALRKYEIKLDEEDPLQKLFENIEKNGNSDIDFDKFIDYVTYKLSNMDSDGELSTFFSLILGQENTDKIDFQILRKLNKDLTDEEINEMIKRTDSDKDDKINFEDFRDIINKRV